MLKPKLCLVLKRSNINSNIENTEKDRVLEHDGKLYLGHFESGFPTRLSQQRYQSVGKHLGLKL